MKTKKLFLSCFIVSLIFMNLNAQLKIHDDGDVTIGTLSENTSSQCYVYNSNTAHGQISLYALKSKPGDGSYYGIGLQGYTYSGQGYAYGVRGYANNSTAGAGRAWGVFGYANNATSGYNYGVMGQLGGTRNGAAIIGTAGSASINVPGRYAGYFVGSVKVTGELWALDITESDKRLKQEIKEISKEKIHKLNDIQGAEYKLNRGIDLCNIKQDTSSNDEVTNQFDDAIYNKNHYGFIAQDIQKIYPDLVYENEAGVLGIHYDGFIPIIIEALKEQQKQIDEYKKIINSNKKEKSIDAFFDDDTPSDINSSVLFQNTPNPFNVNTEIKYFIPEEVLNASLNIYNLQGTQVKSILITTRGEGNEIIEGSELQPGMYLYTLITDGIEVATKRMILTD